MEVKGGGGGGELQKESFQYILNSKTISRNLPELHLRCQSCAPCSIGTYRTHIEPSAAALKCGLSRFQYCHLLLHVPVLPTSGKGNPSGKSHRSKLV